MGASGAIVVFPCSNNVTDGQRVGSHLHVLAVIWRDCGVLTAAGHGLGGNRTVGMEWEGEQNILKAESFCLFSVSISQNCYSFLMNYAQNCKYICFDHLGAQWWRVVGFPGPDSVIALCASRGCCPTFHPSQTWAAWIQSGFSWWSEESCSSWVLQDASGRSGKTRSCSSLYVPWSIQQQQQHMEKSQHWRWTNDSLCLPAVVLCVSRNHLLPGADHGSAGVRL